MYCVYMHNLCILFYNIVNIVCSIHGFALNGRYRIWVTCYYASLTFIHVLEWLCKAHGAGPGLVTDVLKKFRPVSNLSFISKVIEKVVASRLLDHMVENELLESFQSAYRAGHSTETALLRVHHDICECCWPKEGCISCTAWTSRQRLILWTMIFFLTFLEIILVWMVLSWIYLDHICLVELSVSLSLESCQNWVS